MNYNCHRGKTSQLREQVLVRDSSLETKYFVFYVVTAVVSSQSYVPSRIDTRLKNIYVAGNYYYRLATGVNPLTGHGSCFVAKP